MSREIKFRAFTQEGKMIDVGVLEMFADGGFRVNDEVPIGHAKLMQYTGLKDSYAKEVYDGDRVGSFDSDGNKWATGIVCFVNGTWYVKREWNLNSSVSDPFDDGLWEVINTEADIRVIGNIHENPELLK